MPFVFLLLFALLAFQTRWPEPPDWLGEAGALLLPWVMVSAFWLAASWQAYSFRRQLVRDPSGRPARWKAVQRYRRRHVAALTVCYLACLFYFGWGQVASASAAQLGPFPGPEVFLFAPFLLALVLSWARFYFVERAWFETSQPSERFVSQSSYVALQARHNLILVVPPFVLLLTVRLVLLSFPAIEQYDELLAASGAALLVVALVAVPWILRVFLGLRPLPDGPLRRRLEAAARRLHFRFNDILVWDTRCSAANAMVSGVVPWVRYVVLTDLLIDKLTPDEVEAVFGHEVGHIKHHHMPLYVLFFLGSLVILVGLWRFGELALQAEAVQHYVSPYLPTAGSSDTFQVLAGPALLSVLASYIFLVFGALSRRCESQADLFGCRAVTPQVFIDALEKVADVNGIPRHRTHWLTSWQHPTIAQRVEFIERLRDDPGLEPVFQRDLRKLKWGLMSAVALGIVLVTWVLGPEQFGEIFRIR